MKLLGHRLLVKCGGKNRARANPTQAGFPAKHGGTRAGKTEELS